MATDPVCGMEVDPKTAIHMSERNGTTYHFCSRECKQDFDKAPEKYISEGARTEKVRDR